MLAFGWSSKGLLEASGLDFGSILGDLEWILGGFGEGFGRDFGGFWPILGYAGYNWDAFAYACFCFLLLAIACY